MTVETKEAAAVKAYRHHSFQIKYNLDEGTPLWKVLFHRYVFLSFFRLCFIHLNLVFPTQIDSHGTLGWKEDQGCWSEEWQAEMDAARYPFGGVERVAAEECETATTCPPRSLFPNSNRQRVYEKLAHKKVGVLASSLERLQAQLVKTDPVVERYRARSA